MAILWVLRTNPSPKAGRVSADGSAHQTCSRLRLAGLLSPAAEHGKSPRALWKEQIACESTCRRMRKQFSASSGHSAGWKVFVHPGSLQWFNLPGKRVARSCDLGKKRGNVPLRAPTEQ